MIADMILGTESAEAFLHTSAVRADSSPTVAVIKEVGAKLFASETAVRVSNGAIQVLGDQGYSRHFVVERLFRDARGVTLQVNTSGLLRQDIAKAALGL